LAPVVHGLEAKYEDRVTFVYLDVDDPATLPFRSQLGYLYMPHLLLLDGEGNVLKQWAGYVPKDQLEPALLDVIGELEP
jgi:thioredoxin-like negative regulator of GroEL